MCTPRRILFLHEIYWVFFWLTIFLIIQQLHNEAYFMNPASFLLFSIFLEAKKSVLVLFQYMFIRSLNKNICAIR